MQKGVCLTAARQTNNHSANIYQVLVFDKETGLEQLTLKRCPPLELKHLWMLTSLKTLIVEDSDCLVGPLGGQGDVEWQLPIEYLRIWSLNGNSGKELTDLLPHLPRLSILGIWNCKNIEQLVIGVDLQETTSAAASDMEKDEITSAKDEEDDGVLLFPAHLFDSLRELEFRFCPELVLVDPPTLVPGGGWFEALRSLQRLTIEYSLESLSTFWFSHHIFPSSLQFLKLMGVKGMPFIKGTPSVPKYLSCKSFASTSKYMSFLFKKGMPFISLKN